MSGEYSNTAMGTSEQTAPAPTPTHIALVMHTTSYGAAGFVEACARAGARVVVASDRCHVLDRAWQWPAETLVIDFADPEGAAATIADRGRHGWGLGAVLPVGGELPAQVAALAARRLGLPANDPPAMAAAANKLLMRQRLAAALAMSAADGRNPELRQPRFLTVDRRRERDPAAIARRVLAADGVGFPCVVKPLALSGSRGVMRADDPDGLAAALERLGRLLDELARAPRGHAHDSADADAHVLIESFLPGREYALEGLLTDGALEVLALFDKPDPLDGPYFEETIYVTPSRLPDAGQRQIAAAVSAAAGALGLRTGPIHAEVRLDPEGTAPPAIVEVAARPIGGLCARSLRFDGGLALEDVMVRHALGNRERPVRERRASGVMMIPIPTPVPAVLRAVDGVARAREVANVSDVVISPRIGETVVPLPEGSRYLGFIFASATSAEDVEAALREAARRLDFSFGPLLPIANESAAP
jgi:biotin carboxylase